MNCTCPIPLKGTGSHLVDCPAGVHTYEIRRRGQATYLHGTGACPHCQQYAAVSMKGPSTPEERFHTATCLECSGTWLARLVEQKEVVSL